ncbi:hypothetical protein V5O48_011147 [Marasmius crinis-equi]|uniref:NADP-dependent oxidoreductase domain-containing protein n=1 Tax=Marasmius crinis-equi TaxID=585013 RepID=A0ABR3F6D7_9AGAR
MSPQPTFTLNDNTPIPWLGFGTGTALYQQDVTETVVNAIRAGVRHLDGAQMYQNEDSLGAGIRESGVPRSELFVTTKLLPNIDFDKESPKSKLVESLKRLGFDYVDLYLIHSPQPAQELGKLKELWKDMEEIKKEGLAKSIGISNFGLKALEETLEVATVVPAANQVEFHPYVWSQVKPIYELCKEKGITIQSYSGLVPVTQAKGGPVDPVLEKAAQRLSKQSGKTVTPGHVLIKWQLQKGVVVVTTSSKVSRLKETLEVPTLPDLTPEEISAIEEEGSKVLKRVWMHDSFKGEF